MDVFFVLFYQPAYNLLLTAYSFNQSGFGLVIGIVLIAIVVRLIMFPFVNKQLTMAKQNTDLQEKIKIVKEKYKNDKEKLQEEMLKLNKEALPSFISGCLPLILQLVIFINIDRVIRDLFNPELGIKAFQPHLYVQDLLSGSATVNSDLGFMNIAAIPSRILNEAPIVTFLPYFLIILLTAIAQYISLKLSLNYSKKRRLNFEKGKAAKKNNENNKVDEDLSQMISKTTEQTMLLFPFLLFVGALAFPIGLTIYWLTQSILGIVQQIYFMKILDKEVVTDQINTSKRENNNV